MTDTFELRTTTFDGAPLWSATISETSEPDTSRAVASWSVAELQGGESSYLTVTSPSGSNRHFFTDVVAMKRDVPVVDVAERRDGDRLEVTVSADTLALMVTVTAGDATFDDNCFDLHPGQPRTVTASGVSESVTVNVAAS